MGEQIQRELRRRGLAEQVEVEIVGPPTWVSAHVPRREADKRAFIGDRRGLMVRLRFPLAALQPLIAHGESETLCAFLNGGRHG